MPKVRVRLFTAHPVKEVLIQGQKLEIEVFPQDTSGSFLDTECSIHRSGEFLSMSIHGARIEGFDSIKVSGECLAYLPNDSKVRRIPGQLVFIPRIDTELLVVNVVDMSDYLMGVVHAELGGLEHPNLWSTQVVVARTWFSKNQRKFFDKGECYAVTDDVQSQVYAGWPLDSARTLRLRKAVISTGDSILVSRSGVPIDALFHANSGGQTMPSGWYFYPREYLGSVKDVHSLNCSQTNWSKTIPKDYFISQMAKWLNQNPEDSKFRAFICSYNQPVRMEYLSYRGNKVRLRVIREHFGLRSTWFSISEVSGKLLLTGRGYGHGVGLSQEGAFEMAKKGYPVSAITSFYYPGTRMETWSKAVWKK